MRFSLLISTRGRATELSRLFDSLKAQGCRDFEIVLSDQNDDDRLVPMLKAAGMPRLTYLRNSGGLSRGRNEAIRHATGEILGFPDDDCVYPPGLLEGVSRFFEGNPGYGFLSGKSHDDEGKDSVSRHAPAAGPIRKMTVHAQCIEFALFIRRDALGEVRFDEQMGVGAVSPWRSDEGPDLLLRLAERQVSGYYDPRFSVWHARPVVTGDARAIDRTYQYACGNGYFYRKHNYPIWFLIYQLGRNLIGLILALASLNPGRVRLYQAKIRGRWRGWINAPATG